jgi:hypothetical protein
VVSIELRLNLSMLFSFIFIGVALVGAAQSTPQTDESEQNFESFRLELWSRGWFDIEEENAKRLLESNFLSQAARMAPVSYVRRDILGLRDSAYCDMTGFCSPLDIRGGSQNIPVVNDEEQMAQKIKDLGSRLGQHFLDAIERNIKEHEEDCRKSCEIYYCASPDTPLQTLDELIGETTIKPYSMGPAPPEDFAESFG